MNAKRIFPVTVYINSTHNRLELVRQMIDMLLSHPHQPAKIVLVLYVKGREHLQSNIIKNIIEFKKHNLQVYEVRTNFIFDWHIIENLPDLPIILCPDNIIFSESWFEQLYWAYLDNPENIYCYDGIKLNFASTTNNCNYAPSLSKNDLGFYLIPSIHSGVILPVQFLKQSMQYFDQIRSIASKSFDLCLWGAALLAGKRIWQIDTSTTQRHSLTSVDNSDLYIQTDEFDIILEKLILNFRREIAKTTGVNLAAQFLAPKLCAWYKKKTNMTLDLANCQTYNEKIQWLKIFDDLPLKTTLADKYLVREYVASKIGSEYLIPLLGVWKNFDDIDFNTLPDKFVLKANHGSSMNILVKDKQKINIKEIRNKFQKWLSINFALSAGYEMNYYDISPLIICEPYVEDELLDYKCMCFDGKVHFIWVDFDRFSGHKRNFYTPSWRQLSISIGFPTSPKSIQKPKFLAELIFCAETLSKGFRHARVDFYILKDDRLKFGEITFYSGTGIEKFTPLEVGIMMGNLINIE